MRRLCFSFLFTLAACGGDDVPPAIDAPVGMIDAPVQMVDAAVADAAGNPPSVDVGKPCTSGVDDCPAQFRCVALDGETVTDGFCTTGCGTTPQDMTPMSPMGGDAICEGAYTGDIGASLCVVYIDNMMTG